MRDLFSRKAGATIVAALLVLAALGGCGGPLDREALAERANEICREAESRARDVPTPVDADDPRQTARYVAELIPIARQEFEELGRLEPVPPLQAQFRRYLRYGARGIRLLERLRAAGQAGQRTTARLLLRALENVTNDSDEVARRLGFNDCAT